MSNPQLSNYIRFFQILSELENDMQISQKEKHLLKVGLTLKDFQLINMIAINSDSDEEDFKYSILNYLRTRKNQTTQRPCQKMRCKSTGVEMSPIRLIGRRNSVSKDVKITEEQLIQQIEDLNESLISILQSDNKSILNMLISDKLMNIAELITKTANTSPSGSQKQFINNSESAQMKIVDKLGNLYKEMKKQFNDYMKCHINLMDTNISSENLFNIIKIFLKNLIDADQVSFICLKDNTILEYYSTMENQFITLEIEQQLLNELQLIQPNHLIELQINNFYPQLSNLFRISQFKKNYFLKINNQDMYICFHHSEQSSIISQFIDLTNDYSFFDEINQLSIFLIETIKQARVQCFTPLQLSHMIQDIGIAFIRCSKYLFIQKAIEILNEKYHVEKHISDDMSMLSSPSAILSNIQQKSVEFDFKDQMSLSITIQGMDLSKKEDLSVYKELTQTFNKYLKFIKQCYDRTTYYKFFVKSQDSLIFEFDKKGQIMFVSRPIPENLKEQYNIDFNPLKVSATYNAIFKNANLLDHIEKYLQDQNKWQLTESNQSYEVFMKMEEKTFQGFFVIFQQGWFRYDQKKLNLSDPSIQNKVQKQLLQQETLQYLDKLEKNNPQIRNSVVQMFKPRQNSQVSQFKLMVGKHLDQRKSLLQTESQLILPNKSIVKHFTYENIEETIVDNVDNFDFNILPYTDQWMEKQKVVISIFKRNNFIEEFKIQTKELCEFLSDLEYKYNKKSNPFHNYDHGVAVMQSTHAITLVLDQTKYKPMVSSFTRLALIISGLCHDVAHTGRTNMFEINSLSNLAIRYHDKSVLEQHHAATSIKMLCEPETNFLANFSNEEFRNFRKLFISNILYTDITEHFNLIKNFELRTGELNFGEQENDIKLMTGMIIHTSDFTGGAKKFELSKQWSLRVNKEFEVQYDLEGKHGYPQLPYMKDLDKMNVMAKSEAGFFKFIVRPLWNSMNKFLEDKLKESVDNLDDTIVQWETLSKEQ